LLDDDHISEHLQVSDFCESIQIIHEKNYSYAAYVALLKSNSSDVELIKPSDFSEVMKTLDFIKVGQVTVEEESFGSHNHSKLFTIFDSILYPVPGDNFCFYYNNASLNEDIATVDDESSTSQNDCREIDDLDGDNKSFGSQLSEELKESNSYCANISRDLSDFKANHEVYNVPAPIFVRFTLNDNPLSADNIDQIKNESKISVLVSIFKESDTLKSRSHEIDFGNLPSSHLASAAVLSSLLNAYVAEQTLERIRLKGSNLQESDVQEAKVCLRNAHNIMSCKVDVYFYSRNSDTIVKVSEQHIIGLEMEEAFDLLVLELGKCKSYTLQVYGSNGFLLSCVDKDTDILAFWCFVKIQRSSGMVVVEIYHPDGLENALDLMQRVVDDVTTSCHRVNQLLLLLSLNNTRVASRLLTPDIDMSPDEQKCFDSQMAYNHFPDGHFECPLVYQTSFELFHRFTANPTKVVMNLQEDVLHNFAVSNRREIFVYKDESGSIFYMKLTIDQQNVKDKSESSLEGCINLLVYGIGVPGPSITVQLRKLLHKRLLTVAVEILSSVLTKNPRYHWRQPDIRFVKSFEAQTNSYDEDDPSIEKKQRTYSFPESVVDPGMVVLFFRQNICGSTYIHPLSTSEWKDTFVNDGMSDLGRNDLLHLQPTDLVFYYNTSSSDLDPSLQSESTLTSKGAHYSRQIGTGLAIIEVSLLNFEGQPLRKMKAAISPPIQNGIAIGSLNSLTFDTVTNKSTVDHDLPHDTPVFIRVNVADTSLKTDVLHEWVLLSLNQALMAWNIERQLERIQNINSSTVDKSNLYDEESEKRRLVENAYFGLSTTIRILEFAQSMPDPAALQIEFVSVVRSSHVASMTLNLLEKVILEQLQIEVKTKLVPDEHFKLITVRSSRSSSPQIVILERDNLGGVVTRGVHLKTSSQPTNITDSPIDCPEYTIFFYSPEYDGSRHRVAYPKLFKEVAVGYEKSGEKGDFAKSLFDFKRQHLQFFRRSIAFIFTVKRNRRRLLAYNWSPSLFKRTTKRLSEIENVLHRSTDQSVQLVQHRSLGLLAPVSNIVNSMKSVPKDSVASPIENDTIQTDRDRSHVPRQSLVPPTIRRPKLVGKSIEGSAIQAVAKSRARASATRFRGISQTSTPTILRKQSSIKGDVKNASTTGANIGTNLGERNTATDETIRFCKEFENALRSHPINRSTSRSTACLQLTEKYWPVKPSSTISLSAANSLFVLAPITWTDVCCMLPIPKLQRSDFLHSLGSTLVTISPGLSLVKIHDSSGHGIVWLMGTLRRLKNCRAFVVIKIRGEVDLLVGNRKDVRIHLEGRVLTVPRRGNILKTQTVIENGAAGFDKLSSDLHKLLELRGKLFDHCAFIIVRTMKLSTTQTEYCDVTSVLRQLINMFPIRKMLKNIRSNYKVCNPSSSWNPIIFPDCSQLAKSATFYLKIVLLGKYRS
jgi:hypothetical protein